MASFLVVLMFSNPLTHGIQKNWHFIMNAKNSIPFRIKVYTSCDKECVMAIHVPDPISFY